MNPKRFRVALEQLKSGNWEDFEHLCSAFLASEFGDLRTMASPSGDAGRDAVLFCADSKSHVVFQYSVAFDWKKKVRHTLRRLAKHRNKPTMLVFVSSHEIGAKGDELKQEALRKYDIWLDIRDRNWFVERTNRDRTCERAAEELCRRYVDPLISQASERPEISSPLSRTDARTAFTYLELTWLRGDPNRNLRKVCFDALTLAALSGTTSDRRIRRIDVYERVLSIVPSLDPSFVKRQVDASLARLTKKRIRHHQKIDEFCLAHEEARAQQDALLEIREQDREYRQEVMKLADFVPEGRRPDTARRAIWIAERYLLKAGEEFAAAVATDTSIPVAEGDLEAAAVLSQEALGTTTTQELHDATLVARRMLESTEPAVACRIRNLAATYTLFALLQQTPDVQRVTRNIFSVGDIWLDASICLPLVAETVQQDFDEGRPLAKLLETTRNLGNTLYVIPGVLEEVERHINRARSFARWREPDSWKGRIPFLYSYYVRSGAEPSKFLAWTEHFCGERRPVDDIAQYLLEEHGIRTKSLSDYAEAVQRELRWELEEKWREAHQNRRRRGGADVDHVSVARLADHDVESFAGIIGRREKNNEGSHSLGYKSWWLTIDGAAYRIARWLWKERRIPSPLMSPGFLARQMVLHAGDRPCRDSWHFPFLEIGIIGALEVPSELTEIAERIRRECAELPERVLRRKIRDTLDRVKSRPGREVEGGMEGLLDEILE